MNALFRTAVIFGAAGDKQMVLARSTDVKKVEWLAGATGGKVRLYDGASENGTVEKVALSAVALGADRFDCAAGETLRFDTSVWAVAEQAGTLAIYTMGDPDPSYA